MKSSQGHYKAPTNFSYSAGLDWRLHNIYSRHSYLMATYVSPESTATIDQLYNLFIERGRYNCSVK